MNIAFMRRCTKTFSLRTLFFLMHYLWSAAGKTFQEGQKEISPMCWREPKILELNGIHTSSLASAFKTNLSVISFTVWNDQDLFFLEAKLGGFPIPTFFCYSVNSFVTYWQGIYHSVYRCWYYRVDRWMQLSESFNHTEIGNVWNEIQQNEIYQKHRD